MTRQPDPAGQRPAPDHARRGHWADRTAPATRAARASQPTSPIAGRVLGLAGARRRRFQRTRSDERGSVTLYVVILVPGLLMVSCLVYLQGVQFRTARQAASVAEEAARAGAGQLDRRRAYTTGVAVVDRAAALGQARSYIAAAGGTGTVTLVGNRTVRVSVTVTEPTPLLSVIGVGSVTVTRAATADLVTGVEGPDR